MAAMAENTAHEHYPHLNTQGRTAVVTGASAGIGAACARALAADGWTVILGARRQQPLEELAHEIGGIALPLDVIDEASVENFCSQISRCDLLVNNAGGAKGLDSVEEGRIEEWQWMYEVNVLGTVRLTQALLPLLRQAPEGAGQIINMSSVAGHTAYAGGGGYNAAKFGVAALTRALRIETREEPIRVVEVCPGRVETDFSLNRFRGDQSQAEKVYADKLNLSAEDIAETVRWIAALPAHMNVDQITLRPRDQI
ncbi:SDR family oxidoreductase [Corynebacterium sp. TAE3-ERU30]|uniref:SDR family oxidoreductase n=1 Tax=Corynebacterium sp. TAE3-ERU30 TaxID=2849496 RepID=UPI001C480A11|nr:SDR family oxidoreductase [Corynebacterium sp. TAE3-ERU30]MBV7282276.1 SDR family oxidoreductase [Corynebacterium sp. TAE3-ERU30]